MGPRRVCTANSSLPVPGSLQERRSVPLESSLSGRLLQANLNDTGVSTNHNPVKFLKEQVSATQTGEGRQPGPPLAARTSSPNRLGTYAFLPKGHDILLRHIGQRPVASSTAEYFDLTGNISADGPDEEAAALTSE